MRRPAALVALLACGALLLGGCDDGKPAAQPAPGPAAASAPVRAPASEGPFSVKVEAAAAEVTLGQELLLHVTVTNDGDAPLRVNVPRLDRSCATVRMRMADQDPFVLERLYAELDPQTGRLKWLVPDAKELAPGESVTGDLSLTAAQVGTYRVTVSYRRSVRGDPVSTEPIELTIRPDGEKQHLGVRVTTSEGALTVKLRPDLAPNTVESFASLVRHGFFDGLTFHRIIKGFMAQGGDPQGTGAGGPGYFLPLEAHEKLLHRRGVLSMARTNLPDTAGSQFFLLFTEYPSLDPGAMGPGYTTFGETVEGDDTLTALESVETVYTPKEVQDALDDRRITEAQVEQLVRRGQAAKSAPKEKVTITSMRLVTLD